MQKTRNAQPIYNRRSLQGGRAFSPLIHHWTTLLSSITTGGWHLNSAGVAGAQPHAIISERMCEAFQLAAFKGKKAQIVSWLLTV